MTNRFKKGDKIKYPNPNADIGSSETLTRTLDAHDAAIVNAALEPTYCAECAENGLVLPHPCPRVTVAPLAAAPLAEKRLSKPQPVAGVARDPDAADFLTEYRTPLADDKPDCAEPGEDCQYCDGTGACPAPEGEGPYRPDLKLITAIRSRLESAISLAHSQGFTAGQYDNFAGGQDAAGASRREGEPEKTKTVRCDECGAAMPYGEYVGAECRNCAEGEYTESASPADPASPDLVAAAHKMLVDIQDVCSSRDLEDLQGSWDALDAALQNTPQPDPFERIADAISDALDADASFQAIHDHVENCLHAEHNANPEDDQ